MRDEQEGAGLEHKFHRPEAGLRVGEGAVIEGYASVFGLCDQGGDIVETGAYAASLAALAAQGRRVKMLWQHDPAQPIGVWDEVREDPTGLYVRGRLLPEVAKGREAVALIGAGAVDGLSIGYRTRRATRDQQGRRVLAELELWEVSLVTFPMLAQARLGTGTAATPGTAGAKSAPGARDLLEMLTGAFAEARRELAGGRDGRSGTRGR